MKFFVVLFAVLATAAAAAVSTEYLPPVQEAVIPTQEYLPPANAAAFAPEEPNILADDGYRYKTIKKYRLRHRRDVNELPSNEYLPPVLEEAQVLVPVPASVQEPETVLADDGYRYKTIKKYRLRIRRDVNELPSNEYLPPVQEVQFAAPEPEIQTVLADDGYRYKTIKKYRLRHRRDVNELPSNEYLPPVLEEAQVVVPVPASVQEPETVLADDGYRYKTIKKYRLRIRRDVNELPSNEYLPPVEEVQFAAPEPEIQTVLADDGYRYKTIKKYRLRHRRDVNELPSNEYLPPVLEEAQVVVPVPASVQEPETVLADDGYRYKTIKKYRLRIRRDVNELPSNEYLPPVEEVQFAAPEPEIQTVLADDGYRYKTIKKYRLRHRRDVNELPSNEYLPPVLEEAQVVVPVPASVQEPETVLADDGYRYKTIKKYRLRIRRDVNELPSNEYLPPAQEVQFAAPEPEIQTVLADDGYRYKTIKKYRLRRH